MMNQKEAVFNAVCEVLGQDSFDSAVELSKDSRAIVIKIVSDGLTLGTVELSDAARAKFDDDQKMRTYTNGLVSNWLRKDLRLNGGTPYQTKNPGSRAGAGDPLLKNLKALQSTLTDADQIAAVQGEIDKRMAELKKQRAKKVTIDVDLIPDDLRLLIGL